MKITRTERQGGDASSSFLRVPGGRVKENPSKEDIVTKQWRGQISCLVSLTNEMKEININESQSLAAIGGDLEKKGARPNEEAW